MITYMKLQIIEIDYLKVLYNNKRYTTQAVSVSFYGNNWS